MSDIILGIVTYSNHKTGVLGNVKHLYDPIKKDHLASPFQLHSHLLEVNPVKLSNPV
jgi:hypothetical protein